MYTLKSIARRGTLLGAAFALLASSLLPALPVYADALNPLTDRSLTLSSSAPGWDYLDGSGNSTYAPPNSGANGQKVGNTFEFKVSTDTDTGNTMQAMSFQYCTSPAGNCLAPGNNGWTDTGGGVMDRNADTTTTSDLNVTLAGGGNTSEATLEDHVGLGGTGTGSIDASNASTTVTGTGTAFLTEIHPGDTIDTAAGDIGVVLSVETNTSLTLAANSVTTVDDEAFTYGTIGRPHTIPAAGATGGNYMVYKLVSGTKDNGVWEQSSGWTMTAVNNETGTEVAGTATGRFNEVRLTHAGDGFTAGQMVRVVFFATNSNYITNPGNGAFFVRINTYSDDDFQEADVIDGGVTVANVMNLGIQIVTKVLETMDFSVGVVDPYTLEANGTATSQYQTATGDNNHAVCEPILTRMDEDDTVTPANRLLMGDDGAEFSLATDATYSTHSFFRLSSNSSAGATVYYSGNTLTNTVGDFINAVGDPDGNNISTGLASAPQNGMEQFGIALAHGAGPDYPVDYNVERTTDDVYENGADNAAASYSAAAWGSQGIHSSVEGSSNVDANASWHQPRLYPLVPQAEYDDGAGTVNDVAAYGGALSTSFAFQPSSMLVPVALASNDNQVVDCITGKVRYIANIAATTPAGIYTTKINYIASPQY